MPVKYSGSKQTASTTFRLVISLVVGLTALLISSRLTSWSVAPLIAWDAAASTYLAWMWLTVSKLQVNETSAFALREDPSRGVTDFILLFASIASLGAVASVLLTGGDAVSETALRAGLGVFSVVLSWVLTHTIFMLRYAELYYHGSPGGVDFAGTTQPSFKDFAYLSFTMGMTFQVSDTGFKSSAFRSLALRHALLAYMFGTVIVATTINLVAGLSK